MDAESHTTKNLENPINQILGLKECLTLIGFKELVANVYELPKSIKKGRPKLHISQ